MPADTLDAALQHDPTLLEHAFARNVVLATPATPVALLPTIAYAWRQESLARNALAVRQAVRQFYARLATMGEHLAKVGTSLARAVPSANTWSPASAPAAWPTSASVAKTFPPRQRHSQELVERSTRPSWRPP